MPDESDPPRKNYGFKEREFKRDERPASGSQPPISVQDLAKQAGPVTRAGPVGGAARAGDPNDVYAVLDKNRTAEKAAGADDIEIQKKKTARRTKDYWLMLLGGNAVLVVGSVYMGGVAIVFGLAGVIIYSLGLTWVVWQIMDKY
jgi:hypothetical protein